MGQVRPSVRKGEQFTDRSSEGTIAYRPLFVLVKGKAGDLNFCLSVSNTDNR